MREKPPKSLVRAEGFEPPSPLGTAGPKPAASASSATPARKSRRWMLTFAALHISTQITRAVSLKRIGKRKQCSSSAAGEKRDPESLRSPPSGASSRPLSILFAPKTCIPPIMPSNSGCGLADFL